MVERRRGGRCRGGLLLRKSLPPAGRVAGEDGGLGGALWLVLVVVAFVGGLVARPSLDDLVDADAPVTTTTTTVPPSFGKVVRDATPRVVRLDAVVCGEDAGRGVGTGFLAMDDRHVVTAAHVVDEAAAITARTTQEVRTARVVGIDRTMDLALLQLDHPIAATPFPFAAERLPEATEVLAIGYPYREPLTPTDGTIGGYDRKEVVEDKVVTGLVQTSAAINPGNSGGPLLSVDSRVVGIVVAGSDTAQGRAFAVDATKAAPVLGRWHDEPAAEAGADCPDPVVPENSVGLEPPASGLIAAEVSLALGIYFDGINHGQYHMTWQQYSERKRASVPVEVLARQLDSSRDDVHAVASIVHRDDGSVVAEVDFSSTQDAGKGPRRAPAETCTLWTNHFVLVPEAGRWVIDRIDQSASAPCESDVFPSGRSV
jgi:serine protease Do